MKISNCSRSSFNSEEEAKKSLIFLHGGSGWRYVPVIAQLFGASPFSAFGGR
jgi:hypothetical protein